MGRCDLNCSVRWNKLGDFKTRVVKPPSSRTSRASIKGYPSQTELTISCHWRGFIVVGFGLISVGLHFSFELAPHYTAISKCAGSPRPVPSAAEDNRGGVQ